MDPNTKDILTLALPATLPTLAVLVGILLNQRSIDRLDGRITVLEASLRGEIGALRVEIGTIRAEIVSLRAQWHNDIVMLIGRDTDKDARLSRLEERGKA